MSCINCGDPNHDRCGCYISSGLASAQPIPDYALQAGGIHWSHNNASSNATVGFSGASNITAASQGGLSNQSLQAALSQANQALTGYGCGPNTVYMQTGTYSQLACPQPSVVSGLGQTIRSNTPPISGFAQWLPEVEVRKGYEPEPVRDIDEEWSSMGLMFEME